MEKSPELGDYHNCCNLEFGSIDELVLSADKPGDIALIINQLRSNLQRHLRHKKLLSPKFITLTIGTCSPDANILIAPGKSKDEYINLANVYFNKGDYDKAISVYREALGIYNNDAGLLNNLGAVMLSKHDYDGAIKYFKVAINAQRIKLSLYIILPVHMPRKVNTTGFE